MNQKDIREKRDQCELKMLKKASVWHRWDLNLYLRKWILRGKKGHEVGVRLEE